MHAMSLEGTAPLSPAVAGASRRAGVHHDRSARQMTGDDRRARGPRIALYSHDTMGLGHVRRNQLIAMALAAPPLNATVLLVTGIREGGAFPMPEGIDAIVLPAYRKGEDGRYTTRSLHVGVGQLADFRADLIDLALKRFQPDLFIADNVPAGALGELLPALTRMRNEGCCHRVLGLRDILDCPDAIRREWAQRGNFRIIRQLYDAVWVYGDPAVYATLDAYAFPADIRAKAIYTGYLDPLRASAPRLRCRDMVGDGRAIALCSVGGGQDGFALAERFAAAPMPAGMRGVIVGGPLMPLPCRRALRARVARRGDMALVEDICDLVPLLQRCARVVAMAGYNTANEILASGRPALFVPRSQPRSEQLIRARRLEGLGLAACLEDGDATAEAIGAWLARPAFAAKARGLLDFGGLDTIVRRASVIAGHHDRSHALAAAPASPELARPHCA